MRNLKLVLGLTILIAAQTTHAKPLQPYGGYVCLAQPTLESISDKPIRVVNNLRGFLESLSPASRNLEGLLRAADLNNDGLISKDEIGEFFAKVLCLGFTDRQLVWAQVGNRLDTGISIEIALEKFKKPDLIAQIRTLPDLPKLEEPLREPIRAIIDTLFPSPGEGFTIKLDELSDPAVDQLLYLIFEFPKWLYTKTRHFLRPTRLPYPTIDRSIRR